ncbi:MAG: hypothetical protein ACTSQJ_01780 [Promethearchaeota archaeon]
MVHDLTGFRREHIDPLEKLISVISELSLDLDNAPAANIKKFADYYINFTVIDDLKRWCVSLLKKEKFLMSDIKSIVRLMFYVGVLFRCCMKVNAFTGLNAKKTILKINEAIEEALEQIISREEENLVKNGKGLSQNLGGF